ncbi:hypothetical protein NL108_003653, partial [Boleophthalmus pectinirostris]
NKKVDVEVEVFTSLSLVNLVKIMHPYCLKLQVEEDPEKSFKSSVLFSKEEVWKYQRPTEDMDEEINVVSDDEGSVEKIERQENSSKPLKSVLISGSPTKKERKRVSFGPVQVAAFDLDSQTSDIASSATNHSPKAHDKNTALQATDSSENDQLPVAWPQKPEGKIKEKLSLQQYRQLRQKRQPLVEKQGNYTTKWPAVSVPPKELTPIPGVNGLRQSNCKPTHHSTGVSHGSKTSSNVQTVKIKASSYVPHKAKHSRPNGKTQPFAPLPNLPAQVCKKSPTKKQTIMSSDPPNPVLVPLPVQPPPTNEPALTQDEYSHNQHSTEEAFMATCNKASKCDNQSVVPGEKNKHLPNTLSLTNQCNLMPVNRIEASDLTSLLEQFEETQAASNSILQAISLSSPDPTLPTTEKPSSTSGPIAALLDGRPHLRIPEPFGTEVILGTQEQPVKRKGPPIKAIQIIDPRPMPFKRTHTNLTESAYTSPHVYAAISSDHDYCTVLDASKTSSESESTEVKSPNPNAPVSFSKQIIVVDKLENSVDMNTTQEEQTKPPTNSSSCSSSPYSSTSRSPPRHKQQFSRNRFSRSRSSSWSRSRSRSRSYSPSQRVETRRRLGDVCSSRESRKLRREREIRAQKLRAIDERRVVYVGRIRRTMTHEELRERFTQFGDVESVSLHFRDRGDHYGFVTFYNMEDAFAAIDNGGKLRRPDELPFDICFGGRRQFCNSNYADL